ncbi:MAG: carbohydrate-binding domain-containing protein [Muribaculaceae bacterium]|nr:carbohydrate-binding domain-containing protein [Muribaculaceae bacterium]
MKKCILILCTTVFWTFALNATTFSFLKLSATSGNKTLPAEGMHITFTNGNLVATTSEATATIALSQMNYLEFTNESGETSDLQVGDVNGDGVVDVDDASAIINVILKKSEAESYLGQSDIDGNGVVDVSDLSAVINIILGKGNAAPRRADSSDAQTMWVVTGQVKWGFTTSQVGQMPITGGATLTVLDKVFNIGDIDEIYVDNTSLADNNVMVTYATTAAEVLVAGNIASHLTAMATGAHVAMLQDATMATEAIYTLQGATENGSFYMDGSYKMTLKLNGLTLTNPDSAAINIRDGKRIEVQVADGTTNTLVDGSNGEQKACFAVKGHTEFKGTGTLNLTGNTAHAFWGKEYVEVKKTAGTINVLKAVGDGFNVNQYFKQNGGTININNVGDDGIQVSFKTDDDGNVEEDTDNTGSVTINGGTLDITTTGSGVKGIKAAEDVNISGGTITITQTGSLDTSGSSLSYSTGVKADSDINITGGTITVNNTAEGGKGLSADGNLSIDESAGTTVINIKANGIGGTAETSGTDPEEPTKSYKVYVSIPTGGGGVGGGGQGQAWTSVYLYKSDGTLVQKLTNTVTRSSGYSTLTFYYYDFGSADDGTYYFKSDNYTSRGTTYTIKSGSFSAPTSGTDVYYSISNSYSTSGTTRTYSLSNVTSQYGGSSDQSEENGTSYNAIGLKADGDLTIGGGTITVANSGAMSKSIKSKATCTINGGDITLTPSGAMKVINNDASYSSGIKAVDFVMNDGTIKITSSGTAGKGISTTGITVNGGSITINNSGAAQAASTSGDYYTAKGLKTDGNLNLLGGTIYIKMTGAGGKGIKVNGAYTQGVSGGDGPTLTVITTGSAAGTSSGGGFGPGGGGGVSGSAKAIKVMGAITINGGQTEVNTATDGAEGIESKTSITINGGNHYYKAYDDGMNSAGSIKFLGGVTVVYSNGNDAVDSNYGRSGAIEIGDGVIVAYTSRGAPEEGFDCDNNSYITITGNGYAVSAGASQGGGGGWGGSSSSIGSAVQGYYLSTSSLSYSTGRYYTIFDSSNNALFTYSMEASLSSSLSLFTAKGMTKGSSYSIKYSTTAPTGATTAWHGVYMGGSVPAASSQTAFTSFTAN